MMEANKVNSTFYALRLLSHGLDTSEIEITDGEEYPASEFTKEEQEQALEIIHNIEDNESVAFNQLPPDQREHYVAILAEQIEELANNDLANAGYTLQLPRAAFSEEGHSPDRAALAELTPRRQEVLARALAKIDPLHRQVIELRVFGGFTIEETSAIMDLSQATIQREWAIARTKFHQALMEGDFDLLVYETYSTNSTKDISSLGIVGRPPNQKIVDPLESSGTLQKVAGILGLSHAKLLDRVKKYRSRQRSETEPEADPSTQRS